LNVPLTSIFLFVYRKCHSRAAEEATSEQTYHLLLE